MTSPSGIQAFTAEHDRLLARGWPELRILTDAQLTSKKVGSEADKGLRALDPYFEVEIPREVARLYLRRYGAGSRLAVAGDDGPIDRPWLETTLEKRFAPSKSLNYGGETYEFRTAEVIYLFEAFLGTEVVAEAVAAHLLGALEHPGWWGDFVDHEANEAPRVAQMLGWLRLRMDATRFDALVVPLAKPNPKLPRYSSLLRLLADPTSPLPPHDDWFAQDFAAQRRDVTWSAAFVREKVKWWPPSLQTLFVAGGDALYLGDRARLPTLPKWQQLQIIREIGSLKHPGAARTVAGLLTSRATAKEARAWVEGHRDWLEREAIPVLASRDPAATEALQATLAGKEPPPPKSKKELKRELDSTLRAVEGKLVAAAGSKAAERQVLEEAYRVYCEVNAAQGDITPGAYFTHILGERKWKTDRATLARWMDLAVTVANGD